MVMGDLIKLPTAHVAPIAGTAQEVSVLDSAPAPAGARCAWCAQPAVESVVVERAVYAGPKSGRYLKRRAITAPACETHAAMVHDRWHEHDQAQDRKRSEAAKRRAFGGKRNDMEAPRG